MSVSLSGQSSSKEALRQFKDPVHTYFTFSKRVCRIIDTPHFQRLRKVKQLGTTYHVWPNASHNRFEHCLGVGYLAGQLATQLRMAQPHLAITDRDVECLQIAGLCHDLGHGPWSHVFDGMFMPKAMPGTNWQHEQGSELMFNDMISSRKIPLSKKDCSFVKALIAGDPNQCDADEKRFLFDIVANKRNGLDVDKFDYIVRDSLMVGHKVNLDIQRIVGSARVIKDQICYDCKDLNNIYKIGENRFELHKMVYNHKTAKAIEYMIIDALHLADPYMGISKAVFNPKQYLNLTDSIMDRIEASDDERLAPAKAIFERIHDRDLYRLTDFKCFPWKVENKKYIQEHITPRAIVETAGLLYGGDVSGLREEDVIVDLTTMHYGMKDANPLKNVRFYNKANPNVSFRARDGDYSTLRPSVFAEHKLQIYSKQSKYCGVVQKAYRHFCEKDDQLRKILMAEEDPSSDLSSDEGDDPDDITRAPSLAPTEIDRTDPPPTKKRSFGRVWSKSMTSLDPFPSSATDEKATEEGFSPPPFSAKHVLDSEDEEELELASPGPAEKRIKLA